MDEAPAIIKLNLRHYEAMLKLDIDEEKRRRVETLIAEAKARLGAASVAVDPRTEP